MNSAKNTRIYWQKFAIFACALLNQTGQIRFVQGGVVRTFMLTTAQSNSGERAFEKRSAGNAPVGHKVGSWGRDVLRVVGIMDDSSAKPNHSGNGLRDEVVAQSPVPPPERTIHMSGENEALVWCVAHPCRSTTVFVTHL